MAIFDLLHFFGLEVFKIEAAGFDDDASSSEGGGGQVDEVGDDEEEDEDKENKALDEFDELITVEVPRKRRSKKFDLGAEVLALLTDLLDSDVRHSFYHSYQTSWQYLSNASVLSSSCEWATAWTEMENIGFRRKSLALVLLCFMRV